MFRAMLRRAVNVIGAVSVSAPIAFGTPVLAQGESPVTDPALPRALPQPGWLADHSDEWVREHPIYQATCLSPDATKEIQFLNQLITHDEYLLSLSNAPDADNSASDKPTLTARQSMPNLRGDIRVADGLAARLQLLPNCQQAPRATVVKLPSRPIQGASERTPAPADGSRPAAPSAPPTAAASPAPEDATDRLVIRFDGRVAALTPSGIRAFNKAVAAARAGETVKLTIGDCEAGADFSNGSVCARRLYSLENRLKEAGVKDPRALFGDPR